MYARGVAAVVRVPDILAKKQQGEPITMLTAYDFNMARLLDAAGVDMLGVGDSLGMVVLGYRNTIPVMAHVGLRPQSVHQPS